MVVNTVVGKPVSREAVGGARGKNKNQQKAQAAKQPGLGCYPLVANVATSRLFGGPTRTYG